MEDDVNNVIKVRANDDLFERICCRLTLCSHYCNGSAKYNLISPSICFRVINIPAIKYFSIRNLGEADIHQRVAILNDLLRNFMTSSIFKFKFFSICILELVDNSCFLNFFRNSNQVDGEMFCIENDSFFGSVDIFEHGSFPSLFDVHNFTGLICIQGARGGHLYTDCIGRLNIVAIGIYKCNIDGSDQHNITFDCGGNCVCDRFDLDLGKLHFRAFRESIGFCIDDHVGAVQPLIEMDRSFRDLFDDFLGDGFLDEFGKDLFDCFDRLSDRLGVNDFFCRFDRLSDRFGVNALFCRFDRLSDRFGLCGRFCGLLTCFELLYDLVNQRCLSGFCRGFCGFCSGLCCFFRRFDRLSDRLRLNFLCRSFLAVIFDDDLRRFFDQGRICGGLLCRLFLNSFCGFFRLVDGFFRGLFRVFCRFGFFFDSFCGLFGRVTLLCLFDRFGIRFRV